MKYKVEYELVIEVEAEDAIEAKEKADELANIQDAYVWIDGNMW